MKNPLKTLCVVALVVLSPLAAAADESSEALWKAGWDRKQVKVFAYACTDGLVAPALREYNAAVAARADRVTAPKPFPEREFRDSAFPMCLCISERVAETWPLSEMATKPTNWSKPFIDEAMSGGRCKPAGMLGRLMDQRRQQAK